MRINEVKPDRTYATAHGNYLLVEEIDEQGWVHYVVTAGMDSVLHKRGKKPAKEFARWVVYEVRNPKPLNVVVGKPLHGGSK